MNIKLPININQDSNDFNEVESEIKSTKSKEKLKRKSNISKQMDSSEVDLESVKVDLLKDIDSRFKNNINHNSSSDFFKFQQSIQLMILMDNSTDTYSKYKKIEIYLSTYSLESVFEKIIYDLKSEFLNLTKSEILCKFSNYFYYSRNNLSVLSDTFLSDSHFFNKCDQLIHTTYRDQLIL